MSTMVLSLLTTAQICLQIQTNEECQKFFKRLFKSFLEKLAIRQNEKPLGLFPSNSTTQALSAKVKELLKEYPVDVTRLLMVCKKETDADLLKKRISQFVLEEKDRKVFRVWFDGKLLPPQQHRKPIWEPVQERQVYGYHTLRHTANPSAEPLVPPVCSDGTVTVKATVESEAVVSTVQQPTSPEVMQAVASVRKAVQEAKLVRPVPQPGRKGPSVQLNALGAALSREMRASSPRSEVFNDFAPTDDEDEVPAPAGILHRSDCGGTPPLELPPDEPEEASEPVAPDAVVDEDFDDGSTVEEEEPNQSLAVVPAVGDRKVSPRLPGWMVDHAMPDLVGHPQLAVVCSKLPVLPFLRTVKSAWNIPSGVEVVMADSPDGAVLKVETGGGQLYVALMKSGHLIAPPASGWKGLLQSQPRQLIEGPEGHGSVVGPLARGAGGGSGGFLGESGHLTLPAPSTGTGEQLQHLEKDIAEGIQQLTLAPSAKRGKSEGLGRFGQRKTVRFADEKGGDPTSALLSPDGQADTSHTGPVGPGSVFKPSSGGAIKSAATLGDIPAQLLDHTQAGGAHSSIGPISQTPLRSVDGFSGGLGRHLPEPPHAGDTRGGHGGDTQPASFEASSLIAPLGAGSVFSPSSSDGPPDELAGMGRDGMHSLQRDGGLTPITEELSDGTVSEGYGSDADISGDDDDGEQPLGADAQLYMTRNPLRSAVVSGGAGVSSSSTTHQHMEEDWTSVDSEGTATVEEWHKGVSPTGFGRLEDDDAGWESPPVWEACSAFRPVRLGSLMERAACGSALVAGWRSCGSQVVGCGGFGFPGSATSVAWEGADTRHSVAY